MGYSRISKFIRESLQTDALAEADHLRTLPINIALGDMDPSKAKIMMLSALGLSLRCFTSEIRLYIPPPLHDLIDVCVKEAQRHGRADRLLLKEGLPPQGEPALGLGVKLENGMFSDAQGWIAGINSLLDPGPATAPAAVFAVSCAFAKLFNFWVLDRGRHVNESWTFNLLQFTSDPQRHRTSLSEINLGKIGLIGAGAIGTGFAFTLSLSGWTAEIDIMDFDRFDEPNLETSLMIGRKDTLDRPLKCKRLAELLGSVPGITTHPIRAEVSQGSPELSTKHDVLICAVDNAETRRSLDKTSARVMYNAGVGGSTLDAGHVLCSRHSTNDPLLSSLFPKTDSRESTTQSPPKEIKDDCSRIAYEATSLAAPFIGLAAGALLVAGCAHQALGIRLPVNYLKFDLLALQSKYQIRCFDPVTL